MGEFYDFLVPNGFMKEEDAKQKFFQIFCAMKFCHDQRIVHRDLKVYYYNSANNVYIFYLLLHTNDYPS